MGGERNEHEMCIRDRFRDKRVEEWRASPDGSSGGHEGDDGQRGNGDGVDTDELNEELEDLNLSLIHI